MNKIHIKDKKIVCLALDNELKKQLDQEADKKGMTTSGYIRFILKNRKK